MPSFEMPDYWLRHGSVILCSFTECDIVSEGRQVGPYDFKAMHTSKGRDQQEHTSSKGEEGHS
jgi:hypothetical protein